MAASDLSRIEIECPKCGAPNCIVAAEIMGEIEIKCTKCHAPMGIWRDLQRVAEDADEPSRALDDEKQRLGDRSDA